MTRLSDEQLFKIEKCSPLLPNPGPEVVEELLGHIYALKAELATARAEIVALLEKAVIIADDEYELDKDTPLDEGSREFRKKYGTVEVTNAIRTLIPTDYAAALREHDVIILNEFIQSGAFNLLVAERERKARLEECHWWLDFMRGVHMIEDRRQLVIAHYDELRAAALPSSEQAERGKTPIASHLDDPKTWEGIGEKE